MKRPITPDEVRKEKPKSLPDELYEAINFLLIKKYSTSGSTTILQEEIVEKFIELRPDSSEKEMLDEGWLDFEDAYNDVGWIVEYDKPGWNESYRAYFTFKLK